MLFFVEEMDMKHSLIKKIPNPTVGGHKLTAVNSMINNKDTFYILKSCGETKDNKLYPMCIYKLEKLKTLTRIDVKKDGKVAKLARHANGITYAGSSLFISTMNSEKYPQLLQVNLKGEIKKEIFYKKKGVVTEFCSIAYIGLDKDKRYKFVIGTQKKEGKYQYDIAVLKGSTLEYGGITFYCPCGSNETSNDIYYSSGYLYTTFFKKNAQGQIKYNTIYKYHIKNVSNGKTLSPVEKITDNATSTETKYEIEGFLIYDSTKYVACNRESTVKSDNADGVFKQLSK